MIVLGWAKWKPQQKDKKLIVTFADEIQSDILQQAKKELENELREQLGSILDLPKERRAGALAAERTRYSGSARNVEPEVLDFSTQKMKRSLDQCLTQRKRCKVLLMSFRKTK